jgi:hypothetical protein
MSIGGKARQGARPITNINTINTISLTQPGQVCQSQDGGHRGWAIVGIQIANV